MGECLKCPPGTYSNNYKEIGCIDCPSGYYSLGKSTECLKCPIGTFNSYIKRDYCDLCDYGYYNDKEGSKECKKCKPGFYSDQKGSFYCKKCEENTYSLYGAKKCLTCNKTISNCNKCSNNGICLECNNHAINELDNCKTCEENWHYNGESCKPNKCKKYYYIESNMINCIDEVKECPLDKIYLNLETKECDEKYDIRKILLGKYEINGNEEVLNNISDDIFEEFKKYSYLINEALENRNIILKGINSTLQIGKIIENLDYSDNAEHNCPKILRTKFEMKESVNILFKNLYFDVVDFGNSTRTYLYREDDLEKPLDLKPCEGQEIIYINPSTEYLKYFNEYYNGELYLEFFVKGNQIFDLYYPIYDDCYPLYLSNRIDLTIKDRMEDLKKHGFILCDDGCKYEGIDMKTFQIRCFCPIKINQTNDGGFKDMKKWNNFKVMKCYELVFSEKGQKYNIASQIMLFILIISIICSIITEININKGQFNTLLLYCRDYINKNFENNNKFNIIKIKLDRIRIIKNEINALRNKDIKKEILIREESKLNEIFLFFKRGKNYLNNELNNDQNIGENNNNYNLINQTNKILTKIESYDINFYNCLILSIKKEKIQNYLIENELNELDYIYYREIDSRKWYEIMYSSFKLNCDFLSTFFIFNSNNFYKEYRIYTIKIIIYFNSISLLLVSNICFYHDETMHKIYEENGKYNFLYKLPFIFISDIISFASIFLFETLIDYQEELINLKINLDDNEKRKQIKKIRKTFKRNRIIFYIISLIIQIFSWYFISCFFAVYINTQIYLLIDFLIGLSLSLLNLLFRSLLIVIFKSCAIKSNYKKFLHFIFKIINNNFINFLFECLIEGLITLILNKIKDKLNK